jgi:hypothetical protein
MLSNNQKLSISLVTGLIFLIVSAPWTYQMVNKLTSKVGLKVALPDGCATTQGLVVHTLVFIAIVYLLMRFQHVEKML